MCICVKAIPTLLTRGATTDPNLEVYMKYVYITLPGLGDRRQALRVLFTQYLVSPHFFLRLTLTWGQGECGGNTCIRPLILVKFATRPYKFDIFLGHHTCMECIWAYSFLSPLEHIYKSQRYFGTHVVIGTLKSRYVRSTARPHTKVLRDCDLRKGAGNRCRTPCLDVSGGIYMNPYNTYIQSKTVERIGTYSREDPRFLGGSPAHHEWLLLLVPNIYRGCAEFAHRRRSLDKKLYVLLRLHTYGSIFWGTGILHARDYLQVHQNVCRHVGILAGAVCWGLSSSVFAKVTPGGTSPLPGAQTGPGNGAVSHLSTMGLHACGPGRSRRDWAPLTKLAGV